MKKRNRFKFEILYINILILLLLVAMFVAAYVTYNNQIETIKTEVKNTVGEFETRIKTGAGSVLYLQATAGEIYKNKDVSLAIPNQVHEINQDGDFVLDIPGISNITGYGGLDKTEALLHEMASSLALTKYFAIVKNINTSYKRVYYASKHHFATTYPYVWSDKYRWTQSMQIKEPWLAATPTHNPNRGLFYTGLYRLRGARSPLLTIGHPIYLDDEFMGTVNVDILIADESAFLERKNQNDGIYAIVNLENEIIAASNLDGYNTNQIFPAKSLLSQEILMAQETDDKHQVIGDNYVYVKNFESAPWRLYYIKNRNDIYLQSFYYAGMIFIIMLLLLRVKRLVKFLSASRDELELQALTDPMTKLFNRRYLGEVTQQLLELARRNGSELSVVLLDIDKFKNVNDTHGHQVGDEVIIRLADALKEHTRKSDVACRFGGEEFVVLLPETPLKGALVMADTLRKEVEKLAVELSSGEVLKFTISIGVSQVASGEHNLDSVITRADTALYEAKEGGRNKVCYMRGKALPAPEEA